MEIFDADDLVAVLEQQVADNSGGQHGWANDHGVSPAYVNDVLQRRRGVSTRFAGLLGFERRTIFLALSDIEIEESA